MEVRPGQLQVVERQLTPREIVRCIEAVARMPSANGQAELVAILMTVLRPPLGPLNQRSVA